MSEKKIFLVRHGETDYNRAKLMQGRGINASINEKGLAQAEAIKREFETIKVDAIITSGLKRTQETAKPLSIHHDVPIQSYSELDEMDFGALEGKAFDEVINDLKALHSSWSSGLLDVPAGGGETPIDVFKRANKKVLELLGTTTASTIVFVLHGRLLRILLSEWLGLGLKNMHQIEHTNGAINELVWYKGKFEKRLLNQVDHLNDLHHD